MSARKMNKAEKQALADYVRWVADYMELRDWAFDVYFDTAEAIAGMMDTKAREEDQVWGAVVHQTRHRKHAAIYFQDTFRYEPCYEGYNGKVTVAHELAHCHLAAANDMIRADSLDAELFDGNQSYQLFMRGFDRLMEYGVDAFACVIAKSLPDIDWPAPRGAAR